MQLKEAYSILEIPESASPEEAKKKFRELSKKFHPDVNKEPDATDKFKKINEAYQCLQNGKGSDPEHFSGFRNTWGQGIPVVELENVNLEITIDFKESVLGCKKEVKYSRITKCSKCMGQGQIRLDNGCKKCNGKGQVTIRQATMVFVTSCPDCHGKTNLQDCQICFGKGFLNADVSVHVSVPAGVVNGNILRMQSMGNYAGSFMGFSDQYTDAFCTINVVPEPGLSIEGDSVITTLSISLIDALRGCTRDVKTINGLKEIHILPKSRNHDEVIIPHHGVDGKGHQKVILDVQYPHDIDKLVEYLTSMGV